MLEATHLSVQRDRFYIFEQVSLKLAAGQALIIRGRNGCGKTTLLRVLAGLVKPEPSAEFRLDQQKVNPADPEFRSQLRYLGHQLGIKSELSCEENLYFAAKAQGVNKVNIPAILEQVSLAAQRWNPASTLSAGQKKRLALARLLLKPSKLWLLDEPYSNLDPTGTTLVDELVKQQLQSSAYVIMTTHGQLQPPVSSIQLMDMAA